MTYISKVILLTTSMYNSRLIVDNKQNLSDLYNSVMFHFLETKAEYTHQ